MRVALIAAVLLASCGPEPAPTPPPDPTKDASYIKAVSELAANVHDANASFAQGKPDDAAVLIQKAEPLESQVLAVPRPTLAAMEAASDLDDLYGRMLLSNQHYEWALFLFQKCSARWKYWQPQTEETARRLKLADEEIAECNRRMMTPHGKPTGKGTKSARK